MKSDCEGMAPAVMFCDTLPLKLIEWEERMLISLPGRGTRNFLLILCLMHVILFVDRVNIAAAAETIKDDLGLSNIQLGAAFSAFNYAYAPFQLVGGWFADRYGSHRTLGICAFAWAVTTMATGALGGLMTLFLARFALGMGEAATLHAATRALTKWTSEAARGFGLGLTHASGRIGAGITAPIVAFLLPSCHGDRSSYCWVSYRHSGHCCGSGISATIHAATAA